MDADELSELAECLEDACREAIRRGAHITDFLHADHNSLCPLGALRDQFDRGAPGGYPVSAFAGLPLEFVDDFMDGFDGSAIGRSGPTSDAFALGRLFRSEYVGE